MIDERSEEIKKLYPLREIPLDMCKCGHNDADHTTELSISGVKDGECAICYCGEFTLP